MCTYTKIACGLIEDARKSTLPLDTALFVIFFIPSMSAFIFSIGTGMLIRAHVESRDRKHAKEYAEYLDSLKAKKFPKKTKKRRPH